jgi:hypothetical protein
MSDLGGGYNGNASLKRLGVEISYTEEQVAEIVKCSEDPIYFIKNYVKIVNVDKGLIPFDMWPFQEDMVQTFHIYLCGYNKVLKLGTKVILN